MTNDSKKTRQETQKGVMAYRMASAPVVDGAANPQGKGLVGFLLDWNYSSPRAVVAKQPGRLLADYFTSLLVLSSDFRFKPAYDKEYYLYRSGDGWALSLIAPQEWRSADKLANFVGTCVLHRDATWSIDPSDNLGRPGPVTEGLALFYEGFVDKLNSRQPLENELPVYEAKLPYYQRLFAAALSRSVRGSLERGDSLSIASRDWLSALPNDIGRLIAASPATGDD